MIVGKLHNKVIFITGSTSGIDKDSTIEAAKEVVIVAMANIENIQYKIIIQELSIFNQKTLFVPIDVADASSVKQAIETTVRTFGRLDVGVNNAGVGIRSENVAETCEEEYLRVIDINLNSVFYCMKYERQRFLQQENGTVANMTSILGTMGQAGATPYVATRYGVPGLTKSAVLEFGVHHIRIVALCPDYVNTPMISAADEHQRLELQGRHA